MTGDGIVRESRPVRKVMSRAKRAEITENFEQAAGGEDNVRFDFDAVVDNKVRAHSELCTGVFFRFKCGFEGRGICCRTSTSLIVEPVVRILNWRILPITLRLFFSAERERHCAHQQDVGRQLHVPEPHRRAEGEGLQVRPRGVWSSHVPFMVCSCL
jgi:hypothetical protein